MAKWHTVPIDYHYCEKNEQTRQLFWCVYRVHVTSVFIQIARGYFSLLYARLASKKIYL